MISMEDIRRWGGTDVFDPTGEKIGTIEDFYLDKATYDPDWVIVKRGLLGASRLIPFMAIDWRDDHVVVCYEKEIVDDSPGPGMDGRLSDEEELDLMDHYGLARSESTGRMAGTMSHAGQGATSGMEEMNESDRRRMAQQAAAAHPFSAGLEDDDRERMYEEQAHMAAEEPQTLQPETRQDAPPHPATEQPGGPAFTGDEVAGSSRFVRVKRYMVTERVEQVPISEEEFEEGQDTGTDRRAA
jgi:hypothetical protein